ncbi:MAG TPA: hypothetical protein VN922_21230, partial [Bacteroidia bacterium]|nr:hypothetical protein [Bacteroidia bacterium]
MKKIVSICLMFVSLVGIAQQNPDTVKSKPVKKYGFEATGTVIHRDNKNCSIVIQYITPKNDTVYYLPMG